jgi:acyl-CoA reductase-like NAD-dependent aldehyde dehydrogenase
VLEAAPSLAAGNSVVLKPASLSPLTALLLGELAHQAGLPAGVLQIIPGPGGAIGDALVTHPLVRKVSLTGSTEGWSPRDGNGRPRFQTHLARAWGQVS